MSDLRSEIAEAMRGISRMVAERGCGPVICLWRDQDGNHLVTARQEKAA